MSVLIVEIDDVLADTKLRRDKYLNKETPRVDWDWDKFLSPAAIATDTPNRAEIQFMLSFWAEGANKVQIWTGRSEDSRKATEAWLAKHVGIEGVKMIMRPSGNTDKVEKLKSAWVSKIPGSAIAQNAVFALDNRKGCVPFWRTRGILCLQTRRSDF